MPMRSVPASRARVDGLVVLEQPRELGRGEVRVERQAAALPGSPPRGPPSRSRTSSERLSCHTTIGRQRVAASRRPTRAPTRPGGRGRRRPPRRARRPAARPRPRPPRPAPPRRPARPSRAADGGSPCRAAPRLTGRRRSSNSDGLDAGRALVDAQQQAVAHAATPPVAGGAQPPRPVVRRRWAAARARSGPSCDAVLRDQRRDVLGDPERSRQAGRADRRDVHQARARGRRPDHVVRAAPGRTQARRTRRSARRPPAPAHRARLRQHLVARLRRARTSRALSSWSCAVGPATTLPSIGREHEHTLRPLVGHRQQDPFQRRPRVEDEELALARIDLEASSPTSARHVVGVQARAVDGHVTSRARRRPGPGRAARRARSIASTRAPRAHLAPRRRQRQGVRDRVGHRFAGDLERAAVARSTAHAVRARVAAMPRDGAHPRRGAVAHHRPAAQHRHAELRRAPVAQLAERRISRVSSSPGAESKPVCRIPELVPLAARPGSASASSSDRVHAAARERVGHGGARRRRRR